jgi:hypothetical protein
MDEHFSVSCSGGVLYHIRGKGNFASKVSAYRNIKFFPVFLHLANKTVRENSGF